VRRGLGAPGAAEWLDAERTARSLRALAYRRPRRPAGAATETPDRRRRRDRRYARALRDLVVRSAPALPSAVPRRRANSQFTPETAH
jgi:hypothetical protein